MYVLTLQKLLLCAAGFTAGYAAIISSQFCVVKVFVSLLLLFHAVCLLGMCVSPPARSLKWRNDLLQAMIYDLDTLVIVVVVVLPQK